MPRRFSFLPTPDPLRLWRGAAVPLLAWFAMLSLAEAQGDLASLAELRFLGLLGAACLAAIGALSWAKPITEWTAAGLIAASWCLPPSTLRGSVMTVLLLAGLAVAAWHGRDRAQEDGGLHDDAGYFTAIALAWQLLVRPDLLLVPLIEARTLVSVCILPLLCGLALAKLAGTHGRKTAWLCLLAVAVVAPGFNVTVTLTLIAVAASCEKDGPLYRRVAAWLAVAGASIVAWPISMPLLVAALADRLATWRLVAAAAGALALFCVVIGGAPGVSPIELVALTALVLPCGLLSFFSPTMRARWLLGLLVLLSGAWIGGDPEALAPGLLVLAIGLTANPSLQTLQLRIGLLTAGSVGLAAGYPWLHGDPLLLIEQPLMVGVLAFSLTATGFFLKNRLTKLAGQLLAKPTLGSAFGGLALVGSLAIASFSAPLPPLAVFAAPRVLTSTSPDSLWELGQTIPARGISLDSSLVHGALLEAGSTVATIEWLDLHGQVIASAPLVVGEHTADWAAGRPDIAALGLITPEPWSRRPSPDRTFFEQLYRADILLEASQPGVAAVRLRRQPDLPPLTQLIVRRLELRP